MIGGVGRAGMRPESVGTGRNVTVPPRARTDRKPATESPVARVCVDVGLAHLDRPFDYLVPEEVDEKARPGARVRVRFAGQLLDGFILERVAASEHGGKLAYLERVVSPERVLTPEVARLARAVADRYAGTLTDVLRLAVPPRHARAESAGPRRAGLAAQAGTTIRSNPGTPAGTGSGARPPAVDAAPDGGARTRRASVSAGARGRRDAAGGLDGAARRGLAGPDRRGGRRDRSTVDGAPVVVADARDLDRVDEALDAAARPGASRRAVRRARSAGAVPAVPARGRGARCGSSTGTRAAAFAPVERSRPRGDLGRRRRPARRAAGALPARPRGAADPGPHRRPRSWSAGSGARPRRQQLIETGWAQEIVADRETVRRRAPLVTAVSDDVRDPQAAAGPVAERRLAGRPGRARRRTPGTGPGAPARVSAVGGVRAVPDPGPVPALPRARCALGTRVRAATCRWCARVAAGYAVPGCGGRALRASVVGARRTAEELGRVFTGVPVRTSGRDGVLALVEPEAAPGRGHAGRRAGGRRRRLRRGAAARHLGAAHPRRPAGRRGDAAALAGRGRAGAARRRGAAGSSWSPTAGSPRSRRWCASTRAGWPRVTWPSAANSASRRRCGWRR